MIDRLLRLLLFDTRRIDALARRMEKFMADTTKEIADIKTEVLAYRDAVVAKIADLEAQIAAGGGVSPEIQSALDDLKATADSLQVPA